MGVYFADTGSIRSLGGCRPPHPPRPQHPSLREPAGRPGSSRPVNPENGLRIRPGIFDFEPDLGLKLDQTEPKISGTVPISLQTTIPNDSGPISACFDGDPKLINCEIAQPLSSAGQSRPAGPGGGRGVGAAEGLAGSSPQGSSAGSVL